MSAPDTDQLRDAQLQVLGDLIDFPVADQLGRRFQDAGFELYLVGGTVRDALRGSTSVTDLDFATSALPQQTQEVLEGWADNLWLTGARFGTISASRRGSRLEITTFRSDDYTPGSRHPDVSFGQDLLTDLSRRDFTVNAIAMGLPDHRVIDPFGGWEDLRDKVLRTPIDPETSFSDDPLRMIRLARFTASLGFTPAAQAVSAATNMAQQLRTVSVERVQLELDKLLTAEHFSAGMDLLVQTGLADIVLPEVPALAMQHDPLHHHKDVYQHTLAVVEACARGDVVLRMAALLHDIGKPATREFHGDGTVSFHHHDVVGARMARHRLRELKYSKDMIRNVSELVRLHLRFHGYSDGDWTDAAVRRYVHDAGTPEQLRRLNQLTRADVTTRNKAKRRRFARAMDNLEARIEVLAKEQELQAVRPAIDGTQMIAYLGVPPGPVIGRAWDHLKELAIDHGPMSTDRAYELLDEWARGQGLEPDGLKVPPKPKKDD
ncbi:MAG: CCA tRNA nucleotidyltransferase [Euzebya sp.]